MANINISTSMTPEQLATVTKQIQDMSAAMPFLIGLTPDDRKSLRKMGDTRTSFVRDIRTTALANPDSIPSDIDLVEFDQKVQLTDQLDQILAIMRPLFEALSDTNMAVGSQAMAISDVCYGHLKYSARTNPKLNDSIELLAKRFKQQRVSNPELAQSQEPLPDIA